VWAFVFWPSIQTSVQGWVPRRIEQPVPAEASAAGASAAGVTTASGISGAALSACAVRGRVPFLPCLRPAARFFASDFSSTVVGVDGVADA